MHGQYVVQKKYLNHWRDYRAFSSFYEAQDFIDNGGKDFIPVFYTNRK